MPVQVHIAIDGYSSCGKSTLAKALAKHLHIGYIDSGAMYRAVTLYILRNGINISSEEEIEKALERIHISFHRNSQTGQNETYLNEENVEDAIRTMGVNNFVSEVSAIAVVRKAMVSLQQLAGQGRSIAMDGRDIGTTVFPDAEVKIFMTAAPEVRASRRYLELMRKNTPATLQEVEENLAHRDHEDTHRTESPLRKADDAQTLDNTHMTEEEQLEWALQVIDAARLARLAAMSATSAA
jgi:CMP/dCMP kinase